MRPGSDRARGDGIDRNAKWRELARERSGKANDAHLAAA